MKACLKLFGSCLLGNLLTASSFSAVLAGWELNGLTGYGQSPFDPTTVGESGYGVDGLTRGPGVGTGGTGAANGWGGTSWNETSFAAAVTAGNFVTFSLSISNGYSMSIESIDAYNIRRSGSGPTTGLWQYSLDEENFVDLSAEIVWGDSTTSAGNNQSEISLWGITDLQDIEEGATVTFRLVNWGATASGGTWYFNEFQSGDDFMINGTITDLNLSAVPEPGSALAGVLLACGLLIRQRVGPMVVRGL